jgi:DNA polymerase III sliding clamp (beta) subunit (PCNA family)
MKIQTNELLKILEAVKPGLASKEKLTQSDSFVFKNKQVITFNDSIRVTHPLKQLDFEGAVKSVELYKILSKIKQEEIELLLNETETTLVLKAGRVKASLVIEAHIKLPFDDIGKIGEWKNIPETFNEYLQFVIPCAAKHANNIAGWVHVDKSGYIEALNGEAVARCKFDRSLPFPSFLLKATDGSEVIRLTPVQISVNTNWVHFKTKNDVIISCRAFGEGVERFPATNHLFDTEEGLSVTFPKNLNTVLERAAVFSKRDYFADETIEVSLSKNRCRVVARSETGSLFEEEANIKYDDERIVFNICPTALQFILSETQMCTICERKLHFSSDLWAYVAAVKGEVK